MTEQLTLSVSAPNFMFIISNQVSNSEVSNPDIMLPNLLLSHSVLVSDSLRPHGLQHTRLPCPSLSP